MSMIRLLGFFYRSLLGQTLLLFALIFGAGLYYFALRPVAEMRALTHADDPMLYTLNLLGGVFSRHATAEAGSAEAQRMLGDDPVLRRLQALNPGFRYHVQAHGRRQGDPGGPRLLPGPTLAALEALRRVPTDGTLCLNLEGDPRVLGRQADYHYSDCRRGLPYYYEYTGLEHPLPVAPSGIGDLLRQVGWPYSRVFVASAGVIALLVLALLALHLAQMRRLARLAESLDLDRLEHELPERGLPVEVRALVRALNRMIARADAVQKRRRFFLSAAAHEMRTPLTVLRMRLEQLDEGALKDKLVADVGRLKELVNQLLTLMSLGSHEAPFTDVDLLACVRTTVADRQAVADARGVRLFLDTAVPAFALRGDAGLIEVALGNLLDNAISVCGPGDRVSLHVGADGEVRVRDGGPGLDESMIDSLFEPFVRRSSGREGYGLGLAIVKVVIELHQGQVQARNCNDPRGAEFSARFAPLPASR